MDYNEENHNNLIDAILSGCTEKAKLDKLIENVKERKFLVHRTKDRNISPVGACIASGNMELLNTLISHGAHVDFSVVYMLKYPVHSPVEVAIKSQKPDMLQRLLEAGARVEYDSYICRAMFYSDEQLCCFTILMKHILDNNLIVDGHWYWDKNRKFSPFHAAIDYYRGMYKGWERGDPSGGFEYCDEGMNIVVRLVDILINLGFPLDTVVTTMIGSPTHSELEGFWCPLELAIMNENCKAAVLLIRAGCVINYYEFNDYEPDEHSDILHYCISYRTFELVRIVVHAGAKVTGNHLKAIWQILNGEDIDTYRPHDEDKKPSMDLVEWLTHEISNPGSLKRLCRLMIRNHLRKKTKGCTILLSIEQLEIPQYTKEYLALEIL